jgi:hypothetical protein
MNLEAMMTLQSMLIVVLVIATTGIATAQIFRDANSPFLITITGSRRALVVCGAILWILAVALGILTLLIVSAVTSPMIGIALFFGVEAVLLDICANRTRYVRHCTPVAQHARVRVTSPFNP